jgi:ABC-type sugar transport system substrate-binding protein
MGRSGVRASALAALLVATLGVAACGGDDDTATGQAASSGGGSERVNVAHFVAVQANPVEQIIIDTAKKVAKDEGADITTFDSNNDIQKELSNCNDAIASQKYDVFELKAVSGPPIMSCARQAIAAGIPVVAQGTPLGPEQTAKPQVKGLSGSVVTLFSTNGNTIADITEKACQKQDAKPCKVIYLFGPLAFDGASVTRKAFLDRVKTRYPDIQIVATATQNYDPDTSSTLMRQLLQKHPDINVVANDCEQCALAGINVLKNLKLQDKVLQTTAGASKPGAAAVKRGDIFASAVLLPASEARAGTEMAIKVARKEPIDKTDVAVVEDLSPVGPYIDKSNVDKFTPEW